MRTSWNSWITNEIVRGKRGITADTTLRLARYLGTSPDIHARRAKQAEIERSIRPRSAAP